MATEKMCNICGVVKTLSLFPKRKSGSADGHLGKCKECHNSYARQWTAEHGNEDRVKYRRRYNVQKGDAKRRLIPFLLTFDEWMSIWSKSGHLDDVGCFDGQYCMARYGDKGPYAVGNVRICTINENHSEKRHSLEARAKIAQNNRVRFLR